MQANSPTSSQSIQNISLLLLAVFVGFFGIYGTAHGWFRSIESLQSGIEALGIFGVVVFLLIHIIQMVLPLLPNQIISVAGVVIFGPLFGFAYNFVGGFVGSLIVFHLSRTYGLRLIHTLFSEKTIARYQEKTHSSRFVKFFTFAIVCPGFPDDLLCYLAGTTCMKWGQFCTIVCTGRAVSAASYSLFSSLTLAAYQL